MVSPLVIPMKVLFQELCQNKVGWDELLSEPFERQWRNWILDLSSVPQLSIPRCYLDLPGQVLLAELHGFSDASVKAYAACIYLRLTTEFGCTTNLVASKTKVAPLVKQSLPRLELLGAVVLSRLINSIDVALKHLVKISRLVCWTDSSVCLHWIKGNKEWKQFVTNRVTEVKKLVPAEAFRFCPGTENPADIPTRGTTLSKLCNNDLWWYGPPWLREDESHWPTFEMEGDIPMEAISEMKVKDKRMILENQMSLLITDSASLSLVLDPQYFSDIQHLFRVTAWINRFVNNCQKGKMKKCEKGDLTLDEIDIAENMWIKEIQRGFTNERLKQLTPSLGLFLDESGIIRSKGRLGNTSLPYRMKYPSLLDPEHYLTGLIITSCHQKVLHNGVKETLTELRTRYWLIKGRQRIKKIIFNCKTCKKLEGKPYLPPPGGDLPRFRVEEELAFSNVGADFAGPLWIKSSSDPNQQTVKAWIALFTCATSRALHLELVTSMSAEAFLRCFRRYVSRRGIPKLVVSDNAKSFKSAAGTLVALFELSEVKKYFTENKIRWRFNLEKAPWWGGFFERLVKSTKRCLKKILANARLNYEELLTLLCEVEAVLNSRPITYVYCEDMETPLTPSHLVLGKRLLTLPDPPLQEDFQEGRVEVTRRAKYLQVVSTHFWRRFRREYLLSLREHYQPASPGVKGTSIIQEGDIVTVHEENLPRSLWRIAKVESLIKGKDGHARGAVVRLGERGKKSTTLQRPIQRLFPLEVQSTSRKLEPKTEPEVKKEMKRPRRQAAIDADVRRQLLDKFA